MIQSNRPLTIFFFLLICCLPRFVKAQLEVHPYLGMAVGDLKESQIALSDGQILTDPGLKYSLGLDVHVGSRRLAPLFGAVYGSRNTDVGAGKFRFSRFSLPLGLAYRLRGPDTSFNLVAHGAFAPSVEWFSNEDPSATNSELVYGGRAGLLVYFDFITVGADYYFGSPDGQFLLRLGGRF